MADNISIVIFPKSDNNSTESTDLSKCHSIITKT